MADLETAQLTHYIIHSYGFKYHRLPGLSSTTISKSWNRAGAQSMLVRKKAV